MKKKSIVQGNQSFLCVAFGLFAVCDLQFKMAVLESLREKTQYGLEIANHSGYIRIDSTDVVAKRSHESFIGAVKENLLEKVGTVISSLIRGELADEAVVTIDGYKFDFKIVQYERDSSHGWATIESASLAEVPENEKLGRVVELVITVEEYLMGVVSSEEQTERTIFDENSFQKALAAQCKTFDLLPGQVWALAKNVFAAMIRKKKREIEWIVEFYFDDREVKLRDEDSKMERMMSEVKGFLEEGFTVASVSENPNDHLRVAHFHNDPTGYDPNNVIACASNLFVGIDNSEIEWFDFAEVIPFSLIGR